MTFPALALQRSYCPQIPNRYAVIPVGAVQSSFDLSAIVADDGLTYNLRGLHVVFYSLADVTFRRGGAAPALVAGTGIVTTATTSMSISTLPTQMWVDPADSSVVQVIAAGATSLFVLWSSDELTCNFAIAQQRNAIQLQFPTRYAAIAVAAAQAQVDLGALVADDGLTYNLRGKHVLMRASTLNVTIRRGAAAPALVAGTGIVAGSGVAGWVFGVLQQTWWVDPNPSNATLLQYRSTGAATLTLAWSADEL